MAASLPLQPEDAFDSSQANSRSRLCELMALALEEGRRCTYVTTAYNVGALLVNDADGAILARGHSRELPGNTHAEECCLLKMGGLPSVRRATLVTTMEPCSLRLSGKKPCCIRILEVPGIKRVVIGVSEPKVFVQNCTGSNKLREAGVEVVYLTEYEDECRKLNSHLEG